MIPQKISSQIAYYDALDLYSRAIKNERTDPSKKGELLLPQHADVYKVLKYYVPDSTSTGQIVQAFNENPFFSINGSIPRGGSVKNGRNLKSLIGGLNVTEYADAIAALMIDRAKQELTIAFFNRFKDFADKNPEFKILFPKTTDNLANLLAYTYPQMLPALRNGFFEDLKKITYNLDDVLDLPRYRTLLRDFPEVRMAVKSIRVVHELETGASNAADIVKEFSDFEEWSTTANKDMYNAGSCLKVAALFSESIRANSTLVKNEVWVNAKEVKQLFVDPVLFKIYLGLIFQQSKKIEFYKSDGTNKVAFSELLAGKKDDLFTLQTKIKEYFDLAANVNTSFRDLKTKIDKKEESPSNADIYNYINTSIDAIEYGFSIMKVFHIKDINLAPDNYLAIARKSNDLYKSIYSKEYTHAIEHAFDIFSKLNAIIEPNIDIKTIEKANIGDAKDEVKRLKNGDPLFGEISGKEIDAVADLNSADENIKQLVQYRGLEHLMVFLDKVKPYALFMANIVESDTEEEITAALNNVILPVGSSTIKKNTEGWLGNISIQSYLGAYWIPFKKSSNSTFPNSWDDKFGVIAPIGISWTPGFCSWRRGGALSVFATLIDLGAIVDYKLEKENRVSDNGSSEEVIVKDYKIELGQIFSPGGYLVYGFPWNLPLSLGFGGQYGPGLSKIDAGGNTVVTNPSWRWNVFLAVDIPLFNLANSNKPLRH